MQVASPYKSAYNAAKHGVLGLTKTVALETATAGNVTCNAVSPGYVWTELLANQVANQAKALNIKEEEVVNSVFLRDQPIKRFILADEVGAVVKFLADEGSGASPAATSLWTAVGRPGEDASRSILFFLNTNSGSKFSG